MGRYLRRNWALPIFLLFIFYLDGVLTSMILNGINTYDYRMIPSTLMMSFILLAMDDNRPKSLYWMAAIFGFLYDCYYTGILGINVFGFMLIVWVVRQLRGKFTRNFFTTWILTIVIYLVYENVIYIIYHLLNLHSQGYIDFLQSYLMPSSLLNSLIAFILILIIPHFVHWIEK